MSHRSRYRGFFLWGTSLAGLVGLLSGMSAQPPPDFAVVGGTVRGPDGPLPENAATVTLTLEQALEGERWVGNWSETQALQDEGRFRFSEVPPGEYKLAIEAEGFADRFLGGLVVEEGKTYDWDVRVVPRTVVRGRILQADGTPLANTQVDLWSALRSELEGVTSNRLVTTDAEGRYELEVDAAPEMTLQLTLERPGEGYAFTPVLSLALGGTREGMDLRLRPGYTLTGVARESETHEPVPGLPLALKSLACLEEMDWAGAATTDVAGVFIFQNLPPGVYELSVAGTPAPFAGTRRVLIYGEEKKPISADLELRGWSQPTRTVQLRQPDGSPLAATQVECLIRYEKRTHGGSYSSNWSQSITTDAEGRLSIPLREIATYRLTLTIEGYQPVSLENILFFGDDLGPELEVTLQELRDE